MLSNYEMQQFERLSERIMYARSTLQTLEQAKEDAKLTHDYTLIGAVKSAMLSAESCIEDLEEEAACIGLPDDPDEGR